VHRAPLKKPTTDAVRDEQARAVQYTLFGTPAPGARPAPSTPHPSIWSESEKSESFDLGPLLSEEGEEGEEEEEAVSDVVTEAEAEDEPARAVAEQGNIEGDAEDVQAAFDALFADAPAPPSPGEDAALEELAEDLGLPSDDEVVGEAVDDPYAAAAEPQECDMYAALAGALSDDENIEAPAHGEEHRVGFDWVNRYNDEDEDAHDPQVWVGGPAPYPTVEVT
jgi:hypothetical protein